jgi:hypothetical protein
MVKVGAVNMFHGRGITCLSATHTIQEQNEICRSSGISEQENHPGTGSGNNTHIFIEERKQRKHTKTTIINVFF